jgi:drug/metabolite transporter (DMT)-like permease
MADRRALAAGLTTVVAWGSAFVAIRAAGRVLSPGAIALGRLIVSCTILTGAAVVRREQLPPRSALVPIAGFGVLWLGVYSVTLNAAERHVDAGTSAMVVNVGPLLIALLAGVFLGEGFPRGLLAGCAVALLGCVAIGLSAHGSRAVTVGGLALLVVATLAYAFAVVAQKVALRRASAFQVTWLGCLAALVACLPFAPALGRVDDARAVVWTVYLGAVPTALGFATWSFALGRGAAGRVASLNYLIPLVAILLGWAYLGEAPPPPAIGGGALCLSGVYLARARRRARDPGRTPSRRLEA